VAEVVVSDRSLTRPPQVARWPARALMVATRVEPDLAARLEKYGVPYTRVVESPLAA
jgi:cell division protease FtsH